VNLRAFLKLRAPRAALVFLLTFIICLAYYAAWRQLQLSELPGFLIVIGGMPWSSLWESVEQNMLHVMTRAALAAVSFGILSGGFSLNCLFVYLVGALVPAGTASRIVWWASGPHWQALNSNGQ
jgi:hypothetical protein